MVCLEGAFVAVIAERERSGEDASVEDENMQRFVGSQVLLTEVLHTAKVEQINFADVDLENAEQFQSNQPDITRVVV